MFIIQKIEYKVIYKNLFLGIRQYDCDLSLENFNDLIKIAYSLKEIKERPGYQSWIIDYSSKEYINYPVVKLLKESFINCCRDYFKIYDKEDNVVLWFYQDWKSNPRQGQRYWHKHADNCYALSGVLYLSLPDESTTTYFSRNVNMINYIGFGGSISTSDLIQLPPITHKWFIYPSELPHRVGECGNTDERRICIAADYWFTMKPNLNI